MSGKYNAALARLRTTDDPWLANAERVATHTFRILGARGFLGGAVRVSQHDKDAPSVIFDNGVNPENNRPYNCKVMFTGARLIDQTSRRDEPEELKREPQEAMERIIRNDSRTAIVHKFSHEAKVLRNSAITKETGIAVGVGAKISSETTVGASYGVISAEQKLGLELSASLDVSHMQNWLEEKGSESTRAFETEINIAAGAAVKVVTTHDAIEFEQTLHSEGILDFNQITLDITNAEADGGQEVAHQFHRRTYRAKGVFHLAQILAGLRDDIRRRDRDDLWERTIRNSGDVVGTALLGIIAAEPRRMTGTTTLRYKEAGGVTQTLKNLKPSLARRLIKGGGNPS